MQTDILLCKSHINVTHYLLKQAKINIVRFIIHSFPIWLSIELQCSMCFLYLDSHISDIQELKFDY